MLKRTIFLGLLLIVLGTGQIYAQEYKYHNLSNLDEPKYFSINVINSRLNFEKLDNGDEYSIFIDISSLNYHVYKSIYTGIEVLVFTNDPITVVMDDLSFNEQLYKAKDEREDLMNIDGSIYSIKRSRSACYKVNERDRVYQTSKEFNFHCHIQYHNDGSLDDLVSSFFISSNASIRNKSSDVIYTLNDEMRQIGIEALSLHRKYDQSDN